MADDTLQYEVTVDDATTWTKPWTVMIRMNRTQDKIYEYACHEGNHHTMEGILGAAAQTKPHAGNSHRTRRRLNSRRRSALRSSPGVLAVTVDSPEKQRVGVIG